MESTSGIDFSDSRVSLAARPEFIERHGHGMP
jgi:hypothetical protein